MKRLIVAALAAAPGVAGAQEIDGGDTAWILTSSALVLFMTLPGLALFYGGLVRAKNVLSILMQCFAIAGISSILWLIVGYSLAFGEDICLPCDQTVGEEKHAGICFGFGT